MTADYSAESDNKNWLLLAKEVEHLFEPLADDEGF